MFNALVLEKGENGSHAAIKSIDQSALPNYPVLVEVFYSSLNYKDALAITGKAPIARRSPLIGGIDLAGVVVDSQSPLWKAGDKVVVNGFGMSETESGGFTRFQKVKPEWLVALPEEVSLAQAMSIGTAGYTAALCVDALENWGAIQTVDKPVIVTGSGGGVGSFAIKLLSQAGYAVTASSGRPELNNYLTDLGATAVIHRDELAQKNKPLQAEIWSGAVDAIGSTSLVNILAQMSYGCAATTCGLASGNDMNATVFPHILRGVALLGIDSVYAPIEKRIKAWQRLARDINLPSIEKMSVIAPMTDIFVLAQKMIDGQIKGRIVIDVNQ